MGKTQEYLKSSAGPLKGMIESIRDRGFQAGYFIKLDNAKEFALPVTDLSEFNLAKQVLGPLVMIPAVVHVPTSLSNQLKTQLGPQGFR